MACQGSRGFSPFALWVPTRAQRQGLLYVNTSDPESRSLQQGRRLFGIVMKPRILIPFVLGLTACRASLPSRSADEAAVIEAALRVIPVRSVDQRIVVEDDLLAHPTVSSAVVARLRSRLQFAEFFRDEQSAATRCASRTSGPWCVRLSLDSLVSRGAIHEVTVSSSAVRGCGFQEYVVEVRTTGGEAFVRSVTVGESGSCGVRRTP